MKYQAPIKGKTLNRPKRLESSGSSFAEGVGSVSGLVFELRQLKSDVVETVNYKLEEVDIKLQNQLEDVETTVADVQAQVSEAVVSLAEFKAEAIEYIKSEAVAGENGQDADEDRIIEQLRAHIPQLDEESFVAKVLARIPKLDEKTFTKKILEAIPQNKASLKIIQEKIEVDPMSVIEKIMAMPEGKFKLKTAHIDGLEQTMSAFRSQLGRGYLHGGGDTVIAGNNITIVTNAQGQKVISATGGAGGQTTSGTTNRISVTNGATNPVIDIAATYVGQASITTLGTIGTGVWQGTAIADTYIASAATWNAKQGAITLTTTGTSGPATLIGNTLNIPQYTGGGGGTPGGSTNQVQFNSAGVFGASANLTWDATNNNNLTLGVVPPASATSSLLQLDATAIVGGSASGTHIGINPATFTGDFLRFQVGGSNRAILGNAGLLILTNGTSTITLTPASNLIQTSGQMSLQAGAASAFSLTSTSVTATLRNGGQFLVNVSTLRTAGSTNPLAYFNFTTDVASNLTASTEVFDYRIGMNRSVQFAAGAKTNQRAMLIEAPTYTAVGATTTTDAATLAIDNAPQAGTNMALTRTSALWVMAGNTRLAGSLTLGLVTKTAAYTMGESDNVVLADTTSTAYAITLPSAANVPGRQYTVKDWKGTAATNNLTIATTSSQTIDGTASKVISTNYGSFTVISDGANWSVI